MTTTAHTSRTAVRTIAAALVAATVAATPAFASLPPDGIAPPPSSIAASAAGEYAAMRSEMAQRQHQEATVPVHSDAAQRIPGETNAAPPVTSAPTGSTTTDGFDVPSAGLGAAGAGVLALLFAGGLALRRPQRRPGALGA